jgi:hypothetical protein
VAPAFAAASYRSDTDRIGSVVVAAQLRFPRHVTQLRARTMTPLVHHGGMSSVVVPFPKARGEQAEPLCAGYDSAWWFEPTMFATAVGICRRCEMRSDCLAQALQSGERLGVWGGMTPEQRAALSNAPVIPIRRQARSR